MNTTIQQPIHSIPTDYEKIDGYVKGLKEKRLIYPIGENLFFQYPLPMEILPKDAERLYEQQKIIYEYFLDKLKKTKFENILPEDMLYLRGQKIGSKLQYEKFVDRCKKIRPSY